LCLHNQYEYVSGDTDNGGGCKYTEKEELRVSVLMVLFLLVIGYFIAYRIEKQPLTGSLTAVRVGDEETNYFPSKKPKSRKILLFLYRIVNFG
jgi:hypothetical protein